jgi:uncharacterized protein YndB with AHSA1/START domain
MTMATSTSEPEIQSLSFVKEIEIAAPPECAFEALLEELGPAGQMLDGKPFQRVLEPWPGGRWYRNLGNNTGHFWGHVQVIKPPTLLELCGPMFMSFPAANHIQYRLIAEGNGTRLKLTHRALGHFPPELRERMPEGWDFMLKRVRENAEWLRKVNTAR